MDIKLEIQMYKAIVGKYAIDFIKPHPQGHIPSFEGSKAKILDSELPIELIIASLSEDISINLYSFSTGPLLAALLYENCNPILLKPSPDIFLNCKMSKLRIDQEKEVLTLLGARLDIEEYSPQID